MSLIEAVARPLVVLGFDYGLRRIGVAVGQMITGTATPLETLEQHAGKIDWDGIEAQVNAWNPDAFVVGLPGGPPDAARELKTAIGDFRRALAARFERPTHTIDEAYTSIEAYHHIKTNRQNARAHRRANPGSVHPERMNKGAIDKVAAAILLEAWMTDARSRQRP
ncbi:MAG: Holliday junction resolvase RuvX [Gammaproteobacteria bacterium]|nr:Holliday junction resolvase RuvX [Gammaproteobacteria bacterium]MBA3732069.1 Holliday junction resolvase RuvX [Gammaproteobacteria bacterium]